MMPLRFDLPPAGRLAWSLCGLIVAADAIWLAAYRPFGMDWEALLAMAPFMMLLLALAHFTTHMRTAPRVASLCLALCYLYVMTFAVALLSYLSVSVCPPLQDAAFAAADKRLGFDWLALLSWTAENRWAATTMTKAYQSSAAQTIGVALLFSFLKRPKELYAFLALYALTAVAVIALSTPFPAAGAFPFYQPDPGVYGLPHPKSGLWHWQEFKALRDGTLTQFDLVKAQGVIQFPSFHTALAIITAYSMRNVRYLGAGLLALNAVVIVSTLPIGGHHLVDVIAGAGIAFAAILVVRRVEGGRWLTPSRPLVSGLPRAGAA
jgi:membrane-associated phospholipid phosphatase